MSVIMCVCGCSSFCLFNWLFQFIPHFWTDTCGKRPHWRAFAEVPGSKKTQQKMTPIHMDLFEVWLSRNGGFHRWGYPKMDGVYFMEHPVRIRMMTGGTPMT